jgi:hypothetical protein
MQSEEYHAKQLSKHVEILNATADTTPPPQQKVK